NINLNPRQLMRAPHDFNGMLAASISIMPAVWVGARLRRPEQMTGRLHLLEVLVHELDRHGAFADRRRDALDRARPDVSRGEHARAAGLEEERRPSSRQVRRLR